MGLVAAVCIYVVMHVVKYTHITYILRYGFIQKYIKTEESHNNGSVKLGAISASVSVSFASYSHLGCLLTRSFNTMIKNNNTRIHIMLFFSPSPISLHHLLVYICLLAHFNPYICTACTVYNIVDTLYTSINVLLAVCRQRCLWPVYNVIHAHICIVVYTQLEIQSASMQATKQIICIG